MKKYFSLLVLFISLSAYSDHVPEELKGLEIMSLTNIDYRLGKNHTLGVQFYFEEEVDDKARREYGIRYQYKINKNWKTKLSYKLAYGYRRDEDWVKNAAGKWIWLDANNRVEHQTRWLFSYQNRIKSKNWKRYFYVIDFGGRYSSFENNSDIIFHPTLGKKTKWGKYKTDIIYSLYYYHAVNYSQSGPWNAYLYAGPRIHLGKKVSVDLFAGPQIRFWRGTEEFDEEFPGSYVANDLSVNLEARVNIKF